MKISKQNRAGVWLKHSNGYDAFIPSPLPPELKLSEDLQAVLSEANLSLGRLDGIGRMLPNPYLLVNPIIRNEAVLSSRIEGTQTSLSDLYLYELEGEQLSLLPNHLKEDAQEVQNYVKALQYGIERLNTLPLSLRLVKELHEILMQGVRGQNKTPGEFRHSQNWIGAAGSTLKTASFIPPPPEELMTVLGNWEAYIHSNPQEPVLIQAGLLHSQFEAIHPFLDGNGRIGRLLITLLLIERGVLTLPMLNISSYFEHNRQQYYDGLNSVNAKGDWEGWLQFFLHGVWQQANTSIEISEKIITLQKEIENKLQEMSAPVTLYRVLNYLLANPVTTPKHLSDALEINFQTASTALLKLSEITNIKEITGNKRNRRFRFESLIEILST